MLSALALSAAVIGAPSPDFNSDGQVNVSDMLILLDHWGESTQ